MKIIGLTGGIGMGKSTTAKLFAAAGIPVWDADAAVHELYAGPGAAATAIAKLAPDAIAFDGSVDRGKLAAAIAQSPDLLKPLEAAIHPLVADHRERFLAAQRNAGADWVLCDIPLLFEADLAGTVDVVVVVTAPEDVRRKRVLARQGMTLKKYEAIVARQFPNDEKLARADYVVQTDKSVDDARAQVAEIVATLRQANA